MININNVLRQLNERHGYPEIWVITIEGPDPNGAESSKAAESSGAAASQNANKAGQASTKGGVKTKVDVPYPMSRTTKHLSEKSRSSEKLTSTRESS